MRWPSCKIKFAKPEIFAVQLPLSFERALLEATVDIKAQRQEIDFNREILKFRRVMMNRAMAKVRNRAEAENFVQEAYLKALVENSKRPWQPYSANWQKDLSAFLCRIVDNAIISHFRKQKEFIELDNCNVRDKHDSYFDREEINDLVQGLDEESRGVMELTMEGIRPSSIAELYDSKPERIKAIQRSSFKKLREKLR